MNRIPLRTPCFSRICTQNRFLRKSHYRHLTTGTSTSIPATPLTPLSAADLFDITIVGGGPVGLALTTALRNSSITRHLKIALVEAQSLATTRNWIPFTTIIDSGRKEDGTQGEVEAERVETPYSNRCSSLTPAAVQFLSDIGAWGDVVKTGRVCPYSGMRVWDGASAGVGLLGMEIGKVAFDAESAGGSEGGPIAYMTENVNLMHALLRRLESLGGVEVLDKTKVMGIDLDPPASATAIELGSEGTAVDAERAEVVDLSHWPTLTLQSSTTSSSPPQPRRIKTRLLIGADGANSPVRKFAEIDTRGWEYDRHGVVATLKLHPSSFSSSSPTTSKVAYQRFLPQTGGPIALLPLPGDNATLVWSTTPENARLLKSLEEPAFTAMVNAGLRVSMADLEYYFHVLLPKNPSTAELLDDINWRLSSSSSSSNPTMPTPPPPFIASTIPSTIASFPVKFSHAKSYFSPTHRSLLVGDAAHTIHPHAGLGLNLGLMDAQALVRTLEFAVVHGCDVGEKLALGGYPAERYLKNEIAMGMVDLLHWVFGFGGGVGGREGRVGGGGPVAEMGAWVRGMGMGVVEGLGGVKGWLMGRTGRGL